MNTPVRAALAIAFLGATALAQAQSTAPLVRSERVLSLDLANQIATATVAACSANGHAVTAVVVDRAGNLRALQRADNAGPHTIEASRLKAYTSASARNTTLAMMEAAQKNPAAANLKDIPVCCSAAACRCAPATRSSARWAWAAHPAATSTSSAPWPRWNR